MNIAQDFSTKIQNFPLRVDSFTDKVSPGVQGHG